MSLFDFNNVVRQLGLVLVAILAVFSASVAGAVDLSGTVYLVGDPLPNTSLKLIDNDSDAILDTTITDNLGQYHFTVSQGAYRIAINPPPELGLSNVLIEDLQIDTDDLIYHLVLLQPAVTLSGVVRAPDGTAVENVELTIYDTASGSNVGITKTQIDGSYHFPLPVGTYYINAQASVLQSNISMPDAWHIHPLVKNITVTQDSSHDIVLPLVSLSGQITNHNNQPVQNATFNIVRSWLSNGVHYYVYLKNHTQSDGDGNYQLSLISAADYTVTVQPPVDLALATQVFPHIDVVSDAVKDFTFATAYRAEGSVLSPNGDVVSGVWLLFKDQATSTVVASAKTNVAGQYAVYLSAGDYKIDASGSGSESNISLPTRWSISPIKSQLSIVQDTTINFELPVTRLSGTIFDSDNNGIEGVAINGSNSWQNNNVNYYVEYASNALKSTLDGKYEMGLLAYHNYQFTLLPPASSSLAKSIVSNLNVIADSSQDFILTDKIGLTGVVRNSQDIPMDNVQLSIIDTNDSSNSTKIFTDSSGNYTVGLKSGQYQISLDGFGNETNMLMPSRWYIRPYVNNLTVNANTHYDINVPTVTLSGNISDTNNLNVAGVALTLTKAWIQNGVTYYIRFDTNKVVSDLDGNYQMPLFPYFNYSISLVAPTDSSYSDFKVDNLDVQADSQRDFILPFSSFLTGTLTTPKGVRVSGVNLLVYNEADNQLVAQSTTNSTGNYQFKLNPGQYKISANGYGQNSNIALPQNWYITPLVSAVAVAGDTTVNLYLPVVSIQGKTLDSNGVSVAGIGFGLNQQWQHNGSEYFINYQANNFRSAADGRYEMGVFSFDNYTLDILAPIDSGFLDATLMNLGISTDIKLDVVLVYPDTQPAQIISSPLVNSVSLTSAAVEWQTDEPVSSTVYYRSTNSLSDYSQLSVNTFHTQHSVVLNDLLPDTEYELYVAVWDYAGNGPTNSQPIVFTQSGAGTSPSPHIIMGPVVTEISAHSVIVNWETDIPTTTRVDYGQSAALNVVSIDSGLQLQHQILLQNLSAATQYYFTVASDTADGNNSIISDMASFTTATLEDTETPLIIAGPSVINISHDSAVIVWQTNEPATSGVSYNDGNSYGVVNDQTLVTYHEVHLSGLTAATNYYFKVSSLDGYANGPTLSSQSYFSTLEQVDNIPPQIILEPTVITITHQSAVIRWQTDEPANSIIEYGINADNLDQVQPRAALVTHHTVPLTGLEPGTNYFYRVLSSDKAGNYSASSIVAMFTTTIVPDNVKPLFSQEPVQIEATLNSATLAWETSEPTEFVLHYGDSIPLEHHKVVTRQSNQHQVRLYDLPSGSVVYYAIDSQDASGNKVISGNNANYNSIYTDTQVDESFPELVGSVDIRMLNETTAIVSWITDKLADSTVNFQRAGSVLNMVLGDIDYSTHHSIAIPNLTPDGVYQLAVSSRDTSGNDAVLWQGQLNAAPAEDVQTSSGTTNSSVSQSGGGALDSITLFLWLIVLRYWRRRMAVQN